MAAKIRVDNGKALLFILLQQFDLDLRIVEPIDDVEVLVKN